MVMYYSGQGNYARSNYWGYHGRVQHDSRSDPAFMAAYGNAVIALRDERHLERRNLAESAGMSYSYLSAIESGQKLPSPRLEAAIVGALGVSAAQFLEQVNGTLRHHGGIEGITGTASHQSWADDNARSPSPPRSREVGSGEPFTGLSPSGALAELRLLIPTMSPQNAATIVGLARQLAADNAKRKDPAMQGIAPDSGSQGLRTSAYLEFWTEYVMKVTNRGLAWVQRRTPEPKSYFTMTSQIKGASLSASFARNRLLRHELYINRGSRDANIDLLHGLIAERSVVESAYGRRLDFEDPGNQRRAVRIAEYRDGHIKRTDEHGDYIEWFIDAGLRMRRSIAAYIEIAGPGGRGLLNGSKDHSLN